MSEFIQSLKEFVEEELDFGKEILFEEVREIEKNDFSFNWFNLQENLDNPDYWEWVLEKIDEVEPQNAMEVTYLAVFKKMPNMIISETKPNDELKVIWEGIAKVFNLFGEV